MGAIGSTVSGFALTIAAYNDYGRLLTKFANGYWTMSGMFHLQRTWIIYLLILVIGLLLAQLGHRHFNKKYVTTPSKSSFLVLLIILLLILSSGLLVQAKPVNWRGEVMPYWDVCLFEDWNSGVLDWNTGILFSASTLSILILLGITQISWGNIYRSYQNLEDSNLIHITGILHYMSGIFLLLTIFPIYLDLLGYVGFHVLLFIPFLVTQIISSITFLILTRRQTMPTETSI